MEDGDKESRACREPQGQATNIHIVSIEIQSPRVQESSKGTTHAFPDVPGAEADGAGPLLRSAGPRRGVSLAKAASVRNTGPIHIANTIADAIADTISCDNPCN